MKWKSQRQGNENLGVDSNGIKEPTTGELKNNFEFWQENFE